MADDRRDAPDEQLDYRVGPADRRYSPPPSRETNWPAVFATLITLMIALIGYAITILGDIRSDTRATSDRQIAQDSRYESERATIRRDLDEARNKIDTVVLAFQYNVNGRLQYLEYKTGYKADPATLRPPQPPQLQGD